MAGFSVQTLRAFVPEETRPYESALAYPAVFSPRQCERIIEQAGELRTQYAHSIDIVPTILEAAGIRDVLAKSLGSPTHINVAKATMNALMGQMRPDEVAKALRKALRVRGSFREAMLDADIEDEDIIAVLGEERVKHEATYSDRNDDARSCWAGRTGT